MYWQRSRESIFFRVTLNFLCFMFLFMFKRLYKHVLVHILVHPENEILLRIPGLEFAFVFMIALTPNSIIRPYLG